MQQERVFDFWTGDVVAGADDHIVSARPVDEMPALVDPVCVAGVVPAALDVTLLALLGEIPATGRADDRHCRLPGNSGLVYSPLFALN
jgi:hypothetical protein